MERIQIHTVDRMAEIRHLTHVAQFAPTDEERERAKAKLRELAAEWRGYPGQRRRGELPEGVEIR